MKVLTAQLGKPMKISVWWGFTFVKIVTKRKIVIICNDLLREK